ncbi:uncharacterized protein METZ01_LOCUS137242, partial [marine metagenome]
MSNLPRRGKLIRWATTGPRHAVRQNEIDFDNQTDTNTSSKQQPRRPRQPRNHFTRPSEHRRYQCRLILAQDNPSLNAKL